MAMDWEQLLSCERLGDAATEAGSDAAADEPLEARGPFLKDFDRIVYSSAFRRLQDKTQVYSFPTSDYVRTRLTHSLEVSSVGRSLGLAVGRRMLSGRSLSVPCLGRGLRSGDLADVVAAACLGHDIGHPPFGHAGEEAVRHWFRVDRPDLLDGLSEYETADLRNFESNAQGFRVLTRLQLWREGGGMRLCCATLGAVTKYPWGSYARDREDGTTRERVKFGFYQDDRASFEWVAEQLGLVEGDAIGGFRRHPLAFLVEAADDICYLIVDLEDGSMARLLDFEEVESALLQIVGTDTGHYAQLRSENDRLAYLRAKAIGLLVGQSVEAFLDREKDILAGRFEGHTLDTIVSCDAVARLRDICTEQLYNDPSKLRKEIGGFAIVRGLLEIYCDTLLAWERAGHDATRLPYLFQRTLRLLPEPVRRSRRRYQWLLAVTDYVSGMTNRFAVAQYRMIRGMDVDVEPFGSG